MFCEKCGAEIEEGSAFCSNCGLKIQTSLKAKTGNIEEIKEGIVENNNEYSDEFITTEKKGKGKLVIAIIFSILILFGIIFFFIKSFIFSNADKQLNLAKELYENADYENAIEKYETIIDKHPENEEGYLGLADCYYALAIGSNDKSETREYYEKAIELLNESKDKLESENINAYIAKLNNELLIMDKNSNREEQSLYEVDRNTAKEDSKESNKQAKEASEEALKMYEQFIKSECTASCYDKELSLEEMINNNLFTDEYFQLSAQHLPFYCKDVSYAYANWDGEGADELFIKLANTDGELIGLDRYIVIAYDNHKLKLVMSYSDFNIHDITFYTKGYAIYSSSENSSDKKLIKYTETNLVCESNEPINDIQSNDQLVLSYQKLSEEYCGFPAINNDAMIMYLQYINGLQADAEGDYLYDFVQDNDLYYYFMFSYDNPDPLLVIRDKDNRYTASVVVYHEGKLGKLLFFRNGTFKAANDGSFGGTYKDFFYTSEKCWDEGPDKMIFYKINSDDYSIPSTKVIVCDAKDSPDATYENKFASYESYIEAIKKDYSPEEYLYLYRLGDSEGFVDDDGNSYEDYDAICDSLSASDNFVISVSNDYSY